MFPDPKQFYSYLFMLKESIGAITFFLHSINSCMVNLSVCSASKYSVPRFFAIYFLNNNPNVMKLAV